MRQKSKHNVNAKGKPSAIGKIGNFRVGDKFKHENGEIEEIVSIDPDVNLPFTTKTETNGGWTSIRSQSYNWLRKLKKVN